jgi:hypothetical protein
MGGQGLKGMRTRGSGDQNWRLSFGGEDRERSGATHRPSVVEEMKWGATPQVVDGRGGDSMDSWAAVGLNPGWR